MVPKKTDKAQIAIIGKKIASLLDEHKMQQNELANILGVSESAVGKWIIGKNAPSMGNIQRIAEHFDVAMADILESTSIDMYTSKRKYLMRRIAKADGKKLDKIAKLMELIDDEEANNN